MNILPKKSWHVRNKDNVARVRKDEANALEEEQECARRRALAEQEARIALLRHRAVQKRVKESQTFEDEFEFPQEPELEADGCKDEALNKAEEYKPLNTAFSPSKHINLFEDFEGKKKKQGFNREYEDEKRKAQEAYERKVGYLTYLGKGATDSEESKPWYARQRQGGTTSRSCAQERSAKQSDPLIAMHKYLGKEKSDEETRHSTQYCHIVPIDNKDGHNGSKVSKKISKEQKHKISKHKHSKGNHSTDIQSDSNRRKDQFATPSSSGKTLAELRAERQGRERDERKKSITLVSRFIGATESSSQTNVVDERKLQYNSTYSKRPKSSYY